MVVWKFHDGFWLFFMAALFLTSFRVYDAVQGFWVCDDDVVISSWFVVAPTCMQVRCEVTDDFMGCMGSSWFENTARIFHDRCKGHELEGVHLRSPAVLMMLLCLCLSCHLWLLWLLLLGKQD